MDLVSHVTVLTATVMSMTYDWMRGLPAGSCALTTRNATSETTNDAIIALISLQALMRHQYQRRMSTRPVPEPSARSSSHAEATVSSCEVTMIERRKRITVAQRETVT